MTSDTQNKKRDRFKRLAEKRTNKILKTLKLLGNCSNRSNYEYTQEEVEKIFRAIEKQLNKTKKKFELNQDTSDEEFKL